MEYSQKVSGYYLSLEQSSRCVLGKRFHRDVQQNVWDWVPFNKVASFSRNTLLEKNSATSNLLRVFEFFPEVIINSLSLNKWH